MDLNHKTIIGPYLIRTSKNIFWKKGVYPSGNLSMCYGAFNLFGGSTPD